MTNATAETFGVYVHVPFCAHRCDYCAFATYADRDHLMEEYVTAVIQEIAWARDDGLPVRVIFDKVPDNLRARPTLSVTIWRRSRGPTTPK